MNHVVFQLVATLVNFLLDYPRRWVTQRPLTSLLVTAVSMFLIGWMVFGWLIYPVKYVNPTYGSLTYGEQANYVLTVADLYTFTRDDERVRMQLGYWGGERVACQVSLQVTDPYQKIRLQAAAYAVTGQPCVWDEQTAGGD